jgi:cytochrome c oxidase cbb3-type subunit 3
MAEHEEREVDVHSGQSTTGHEWDGIKELDTPLPRWWLYVFYATIVAAIIYWVLMPAWPLANGYTKGVMNHSDRAIVKTELAALQGERADNFQRILNASYKEIVDDPQLRDFAYAAGQAAFGDNCRTCHGAGGAGAPGYPSLADDVWIWGGALPDIEHAITYGIRSGHPDARNSAMPAFGRDGILPANEIDDVTNYVISISAASKRLEVDATAAARGAIVYEAQCAICHGTDGRGQRALGAPSLVDDIWLYGGSKDEIKYQIELGRGGVMPNWDRRFDPATIRALSIYVYGLGGGEAEQAPEPQPAPVPAAPTTETLR